MCGISLRPLGNLTAVNLQVNTSEAMSRCPLLTAGAGDHLQCKRGSKYSHSFFSSMIKKKSTSLSFVIWSEAVCPKKCAWERDFFRVAEFDTQAVHQRQTADFKSSWITGSLVATCFVLSCQGQGQFVTLICSLSKANAVTLISLALTNSLICPPLFFPFQKTKW